MPSGGFSFADRVGAEAGLGANLLRLGDDLKKEWVLRISRLDPRQVRLGQAERKGPARLLGGRQPVGEPEQPAKLVEIGHRVGHDRMPVRSGGRGGLEGHGVVSESYDCHRQSIVTEPFFVRKQQ